MAEPILARPGGPQRCPALLALLASLLFLGTPGRGHDVHKFCQAPMVVGRCRALIPRWWYNVTGRSCQQFIYGGCEGNKNNYQTKEECLEKCADVTENTPYRLDTPKSRADASVSSGLLRLVLGGPIRDIFSYRKHCTAKVVPGPCSASFPRWYFDAERNSCDNFTYGGCQGNENNYLSKEACLSRCSGVWWSPVGSRSIEVMEWLFVAGLTLSLEVSMVYLISKAARMSQKGGLDPWR